MFVHFLHDQLISLYALDRRITHAQLVQAARHALRLCAFLSVDSLLLPTTDLVQSPVAKALHRDLKTLVASELLYCVGSSVDIGQLQTAKIAHFRNTGFHEQWTNSSIHRRFRSFEVNLRARESNTTIDIKRRWRGDVVSLAGYTRSEHPSVRQIRQARDLLPRPPAPLQYERALLAIPDQLESHAFLWHVVEQLRMLPFDLAPPARSKLEFALAWHWARSYLDEYSTVLAGNISGMGYVDCGISRTHPDCSMDLVDAARVLELLGLGRAFRQLSLHEILAFRNDAVTLSLCRNVILPLVALLREHEALDELRVRQLFQTIEEAKTAGAGASTAREAFIRTGRVFLDLDLNDPRLVATDPEAARRPNSRSERRVGILLGDEGIQQEPISVAVVLALPEELLHIRQLVEATVGPLKAMENAHTGRLAFVVTKRAACGIDLKLVFALIGKGQERAAAASVLVISDFKPDIVINLGIAGAMSEDVALGDVVAGDQVISYLANSKAVAGSRGMYRFALAGEPLRSDELLVDRMRQLPLVASGRYAAWSARGGWRAGSEPAMAGAVTRQPVLHVGPIASGPTVSGSISFKDWLKDSKRDYFAVEMEASGVAIATELTGTLRRVRFLALRGISDDADEAKGELERQTSGFVRKWAMKNALDLLLTYLDEFSAETLARLGGHGA